TESLRGSQSRRGPSRPRGGGIPAAETEPGGRTAKRAASAESPVPAAMSRTRIPRATRAARRTKGMKYLVTCAKARSYSAAASRSKTSSFILYLCNSFADGKFADPVGNGKSLKSALIKDRGRGHDEADAPALRRSLRPPAEASVDNLLICAAVHESISGTSRTSEMSDLGPQSGPQRALIRPVSPIAIL